MAVQIASPNSVLANTLARTVDLLRPRVAHLQPKRIKFVVGTQINGNPHIGTNLVHCCSFILAQQARRVFSMDTSVVFGALDNAPYEIIADPESFHSYQKTYYHALGKAGVSDLIDSLYGNVFEGLSDRTDVEYEIQTYSQQQSHAEFRRKFIASLKHEDQLKWCVSPSSGMMHIRIPCPICHWTEKRAERTRVEEVNDDKAVVSAFCFDHMDYECVITPEPGDYLDLNTLYRNVIKEAVLFEEEDTLSVMVKGGDWAFGCQPVDWALGVLGYTGARLPVRLFIPQIVVGTGAKMSKSMVRQGAMTLTDPSLEWMLDTTKWPGDREDYLDTLLWLVETLVSDPKHFYRAYTYTELQRIMSERKPTDPDAKRARSMYIYRKYYDMIASGEKEVEIRVGYSSMRRIKSGQYLLFRCQDDECLTKVKRVSEYKSFDELFAREDPSRINPSLDTEDQIAEVRKIFPPEKEALGVLAIEIERVKK